jgi:hypothetical protein
MRSWGKTRAGLGALALVAIVAAACGSSSSTWPAPKGSGADALDKVTLATQGPKASGTLGPRETAAAQTVDNITADYTYKSTLITPIAHLYGTFLDDFVIVTVENNNANAVKVVVSSVINGYTDTASDTVTIAAKGTEEIRQNPALTATAINGLNSEHGASLHVTVSYLESGTPKTVLDQTSQTMVTSRRDFPWSIKGFTQEEDFQLVVAMVTPSDPSVEALIRKAANYDPNRAMTSGYDAPEDENGTVWQRLANIWDAETTDYDLTYISTTISYASGTSQRIRLPGEVVDEASGNCIELSLLYASVVEALGMESSIVFLPGHAFIAVKLDRDNDYYYFIETTMIGQATFNNALKEGLAEWKQIQTHVANGDQDYGFISISEARDIGITPIPWR